MVPARPAARGLRQPRTFAMPLALRDRNERTGVSGSAGCERPRRVARRKGNSEASRGGRSLALECSSRLIDHGERSANCGTCSDVAGCEALAEMRRLHPRVHGGSVSARSGRLRCAAGQRLRPWRPQSPSGASSRSPSPSQAHSCPRVNRSLRRSPEDPRSGPRSSQRWR